MQRVFSPFCDSRPSPGFHRRYGSRRHSGFRQSNSLHILHGLHHPIGSHKCHGVRSFEGLAHTAWVSIVKRLAQKIRVSSRERLARVEWSSFSSGLARNVRSSPPSMARVNTTGFDSVAARERCHGIRNLQDSHRDCGVRSFS